MGEELLPPYCGGVTEKNATFAFSTHTKKKKNATFK